MLAMDIDNGVAVKISVDVDNCGMGLEVQIGWIWIIISAICAIGYAIYHFTR